MTDSMLNKWDYSGLSEACYSGTDQITYRKAADFLVDDVEDWGCGTGWAKRYFTKYHGVDGSPSSFVKPEDVVDLVWYTSNVKNILIKDTLEYNLDWKKILENAKKSFRRRLCIQISTPIVNKTRVGKWHLPIRADGSRGKCCIPEIYFKRADVLDLFPKDKYKVRDEFVKTGYLYGKEWIIYVEKI